MARGSKAWGPSEIKGHASKSFLVPHAAMGRQGSCILGVVSLGPLPATSCCSSSGKEFKEMRFFNTVEVAPSQ
eukprot:s2233_g10.t1